MSTQAEDAAAVVAFCATAAGITADKVWQTYGGMPRSTGGYITVLAVAEVEYGLPQRDDTLIDGVNVAAITQVVEQTWSITAYGSAAADWIDLIRRAWRVELGPTATMIAAGVTPLHAQAPMNQTRLLDTGYETRWNVTLTSLAARSTTYTDVDGTASVVVDLTLIRDPDEVAATATLTYPEP